MKIISWNVNGLRACCVKDGFFDYLKAASANIIAIQETRVNEPVPEITRSGYKAAWNYAEQKGYAGTAILYRKTPIAVKSGLDNKAMDDEGRLLTLEYPELYIVNTYTPTRQGSKQRFDFRTDWDRAFIQYIEALNKNKPVIICGDFNVAKDYIDVYSENVRNVEDVCGFIDDERDKMNDLLDVGMVDVYRELHPDDNSAYTWWSKRFNNRGENRGRRLDYILVSRDLLPNVKNCTIRSDITYSDHAPVELMINYETGK
jgi:exodeoxyribonuclease-3